MTYQECIESLIEIKELLVYLLAEKGEKSIEFAIQALEGIVATKEIYEELQPFPDTLEFFYSGYHRAIRNIEENIEELSE